MTNPIKNKKIFVPTIIGLGFLAVVITTFSPIFVDASPFATNPMSDINGSVNVGQETKNYIKEHRTTSFANALTTAEQQVENGAALGGHIGIVQGYLVYTFFVVDSKNDIAYKIIIDAGNGEILHKSEGISLNEMKKFGHGPMGHGSFGGHDFFAGKMMWSSHGTMSESDTNSGEQ